MTKTRTPRHRDPVREASIAGIARRLGLETLETRRSDALDFQSIAVWQIKEALEAAYDLGMASAPIAVAPEARRRARGASMMPPARASVSGLTVPPWNGRHPTVCIVDPALDARICRYDGCAGRYAGRPCTELARDLGTPPAPIVPSPLRSPEDAETPRPAS